MNSHDSGLAHGTDGSPQVTLENQEYSNQEKNLENKLRDISQSDLTNVQKSRLNKIENTITNNLKESDFIGTLRDLQNNPIKSSSGKYFQHELEMRNSYKALTKARRSLVNSLKNPNMNNTNRQILQSVLERTNSYISRIEDLFRPYGGIK